MTDDKKKKGSSGKISITSTKKEILAAYNELLEKLREKEEAELKPEEKIAERKSREVLKVAESLSSDGVMRRISDLKLEIGKMLTELSETLQEQVTEYQKIKEAIEVKKAELKEIYEIEKAAHTLAP